MPVIKLTRAEILRITTLNDTVWTQREKSDKQIRHLFQGRRWQVAVGDK